MALICVRKKSICTCTCSLAAEFVFDIFCLMREELDQFIFVLLSNGFALSQEIKVNHFTRQKSSHNNLHEIRKKINCKKNQITIKKKNKQTNVRAWHSLQILNWRWLSSLALPLTSPWLHRCEIWPECMTSCCWRSLCARHSPPSSHTHFPSAPGGFPQSAPEEPGVRCALQPWQLPWPLTIMRRAHWPPWWTDYHLGWFERSLSGSFSWGQLGRWPTPSHPPEPCKLRRVHAPFIIWHLHIQWRIHKGCKAQADTNRHIGCLVLVWLSGRSSAGGRRAHRVKAGEPLPSCRIYLN